MLTKISQFARKNSVARLATFSLVALALIAALFVTQALSNTADATTQTLYGAATTCYYRCTSNLVVLNPANGAVAHNRGSTGYRVNALAVDPTTGALYGTTAHGGPSYCSLVRINKSNAATTVIGPLVNACAIGDIAFDAQGHLYGWSGEWTSPGPESSLYRINKSSGLATAVDGPHTNCWIPGDNYGVGLAFAPSGTPLLSHCTEEGTLDRVDKATGAPQPITHLKNGPPTQCSSGQTDLPIEGFAVNAAGTLYAAIHDWWCSPNAPAFFVTINRTTGEITVLGRTVMLKGIAFDRPTP